MGRGFSKMKKQAKLLEKQFSDMQQQLKETEVEGEAGNGLVKISLTGEKNIKSITISPQCVDPEDVEGLQDLIIGAFENASQKIDDSQQMQLPGGLPFSF